MFRLLLFPNLSRITGSDREEWKPVLLTPSSLSSKNFVLFSFWLNYVYFSKCFPIKYVLILFKDVLEIGELVALKYKEFPE